MKSTARDETAMECSSWPDGAPFPALSELVPHLAPMTALDAVEEWRDGHAVLRLVVRRGGPFERDADTVDASAALEYMAQGVAACLGMEAYRTGDDLHVGMVVACRNLHLHRPWFEVGAALSVVVDRVRGSDFTSQYQTRLLDSAGATVASASMTLVHGLDPPPVHIE